MRSLHAVCQALALLPPLLAAPLLAGGCSSSPPPPTGSPAQGIPSRADSAAPAAESGLSGRIGTYMPPLENGALEVAAPKGWVWSRPGGAYLVGFHPVGRSLNDLPRILLAAEDSLLAGIAVVDAGNADEFVQQVTVAAGDQQLRSPAAQVTLGGRIWAEFVVLRKSQNNLVARQVLQTVVDGRLYRIQLEVFDRQLDAFRDTAYAVAASCRFSSDAAVTDPTPPNHG